MEHVGGQQMGGALTVKESAVSFTVTRRLDGLGFKTASNELPTGWLRLGRPNLSILPRDKGTRGCSDSLVDCAAKRLLGGHYETSPPPKAISACRSGRCRAAGSDSDRAGASLSSADSHDHRAIRC